MIHEHRSLWRLVVVVALLAALLLGGCGGKDKKSDKSYTIGVLVESSAAATVFDGFKAGMTELNYTEGKNVVYVFNGPPDTTDVLKSEAEKLKAQKLDLLFVVGTPSAQVAQEVFADTKVPVLFAGVSDPVGSGFVETMQQPGGKFTGVITPTTVGKTLEWLLQIVPGVKRVYVPCDPNDSAGMQSLQLLTDAAKSLNVELVVANGATPEELDAITKTIPENVDAVFKLRAGNITSRINDLVQAANERRIPVVSQNMSDISKGLMIGYGSDRFESGKQAARLANQILNGTDPATLSVETAEAYLGINLETAQTIGITVSDSILRQAKEVIRPPA